MKSQNHANDSFQNSYSSLFIVCTSSIFMTLLFHLTFIIGILMTLKTCKHIYLFIYLWIMHAPSWEHVIFYVIVNAFSFHHYR